jgi:hypothetical protein
MGVFGDDLSSFSAIAFPKGRPQAKELDERER